MGIMKGGYRVGAGRKPVSIDLLELAKLCALLCTHERLRPGLIQRPRSDGDRVQGRARTRGVKSTDRAVAVMLAFAEIHLPDENPLPYYQPP